MTWPFFHDTMGKSSLSITQLWSKQGYVNNLGLFLASCKLSPPPSCLLSLQAVGRCCLPLPWIPCFLPWWLCTICSGIHVHSPIKSKDKIWLSEVDWSLVLPRCRWLRFHIILSSLKWLSFDILTIKTSHKGPLLRACHIKKKVVLDQNSVH